MEEELKKRLLDSMDKAQEYLNIGMDSAAEQMPMLIQELLAYHWYANGLGVLFALSALLGCVVWWFFAYKMDDTDDEGAFTCCFFGLVSLAVGAVSGLYYISALIKVWVAPRLFLLDYVKDFIN